VKLPKNLILNVVGYPANSAANRLMHTYGF